METGAIGERGGDSRAARARLWFAQGRSLGPPSGACADSARASCSEREFIAGAAARGGAFKPSSLLPTRSDEKLVRLAAASPAAAARAIARAWGIAPSPAEVGAVGPEERLILAGPGAVIAAIETFAGESDLDWAEQVAVIATPPAHRQVAAAGAALLSATKATRLYAPGELPAEIAGRVVISDDVGKPDREAAESFSR